MLSDSGRVKLEDKKVDEDLAEIKLSNLQLVRLVAKERRFTKVDFKYSTFDACYLRKCRFDSCDFTGCRFVGSNFYGSQFEGCDFGYSTFERTIVTSDLLRTCCPALENLKMRFARTLRTNYQQLGDAQSANAAIKVELQATDEHLYNAWHSNDFYYRKHYRRRDRVKVFGEWVNFKLLDWIWGNGESAWKLLRSVGIILVLIALVDALLYSDPTRVRTYFDALLRAPQTFLGTAAPDIPPKFPAGYLSIITFTRLVAFAFLMSIVVKRFNRR